MTETNAGRRVQPGDTVRAHFIGMRSDGSIFGSSHPDPVDFALDDDGFLPGVQEGLIGMRVGEMKTVEIPPEKAFGPYREDLLYWVKREQVPEDVQVGEDLKVENDEGPDGKPFHVTVREIEKDRVLLDNNHPLAGQHVTFRLEVLEIL